MALHIHHSGPEFLTELDSVMTDAEKAADALRNLMPRMPAMHNNLVELGKMYRMAYKLCIYLMERCHLIVAIRSGLTNVTPDFDEHFTNLPQFHQFAKTNCITFRAKILEMGLMTPDLQRYGGEYQAKIQKHQALVAVNKIIIGKWVPLMQDPEALRRVMVEDGHMEVLAHALRLDAIPSASPEAKEQVLAGIQAVNIEQVVNRFVASRDNTNINNLVQMFMASRQ
jgi:hypothetical protein